MNNHSKIALVTGANRGIGYAVAKGFLEKGIIVIATSRTEEKGKKAVESLKKFGKIFYCKLDVTNSDSIESCFDFVNQNFGKLNILVNNAGINYDTWQNVINADLQEVRQTFATNTFAPWELTQKFLPLLKSFHGIKNIVNVSSGSGALSSQNGGTPGYSLSKLALNGLTIQLANQLRSHYINVNAVCPGWVRTDMGGSGATLSPEEGADTIIWASLFEDQKRSGKFFRKRTEVSF